VKPVQLLFGITAIHVLVADPVDAQAMDMPGMAMPVHPKAKPATGAKKESTKKKSSAAHSRKAGRKHAQAHHEGAPMTMPMPGSAGHRSNGPMASPQNEKGMTMPMPETSPAMPGHSGMSGMQMNKPGEGHEAMAMGSSSKRQGTMAMGGALGSYPMQREATGTAWQPDMSEPMSLMTMSGDWMLMGEGTIDFVYDHQSGPRGDDKAFASGMLMGMARHSLGNGTLQMRAMISPDPLMGPSGYPLLLASGETANGRDRLIDRQHPHDFFMELSGSASQSLGAKNSVFIYAGLPGEPAFGPPAFMHREAIMDSPEAPISHHWLDSTHISFGVVTAGVVLDRVKLEVSRFNGREPDQHRWNIETGPLDSTAIRFSWNPTDTLALQASWGHFIDPEQLEPGIDQKRLSASALYARELAPGWKFAGTLAWGRKTADRHHDDAFVAEASLKHEAWTLFGRGEMVENRELVPAQDEPAYHVGKVSLGALRDFRIANHFSIGAGGLFALNFVPHSLAELYGESNPTGMMGFVRLKVN
jgi:hypothetical protein